MTNQESGWKDEIDYYGVLSDAKEMDSDVNEDRGREQLLDDSFNRFLTGVKETVRSKQDMTNVPKESAYDAAEAAGQTDDNDTDMSI